MKIKVIIHSTLILSLLTLFFVTSGVFSFPKISFGSGSSLTGGVLAFTSGTDGTTESLSGSIVSPGGITHVDVNIKPKDGSGSEQTDSNLCVGGHAECASSATNVFTSSFTGLTPVTEYLYQVVDHDSISNIVLSYAENKSFTTASGTTSGSAVVTASDFVTNATSTGHQIDFTAKVTSTSNFSVSMLCSKKESMANPAISPSYNSASGTNVVVNGSLFLPTAISNAISYYCVLINSNDVTHTPLTDQNHVTFESGFFGIPYIIDLKYNYVKIGIKFPTTAVIDASPLVYNGAGTDTGNPYIMENTGDAPNIYTYTFEGLAGNTDYNYTVMNNASSTNTIAGVAPGSVFGEMNKKYKTPMAPPVLKTISGTYPDAVDTSGFDTGGIVRCEGGLNSDGTQSCGFPELMDMLNRIIKFLIFIIAPAIAACILAYAGIKYLLSGGSSEDTGKAKAMMKAAITGWIISLTAWLLIKFIMTALGYNSDLFPTFW